MPFAEVAWLVALAAVVLGGILLIVGVRAVRTDGMRRRSWHSFPGTVVASRLDGEQTRCQVAYRREDGTKVLFWNPFTSSTLGDPVGRPVQVLVNPADPRDAVVASGLVGGGLVGTVLAVVGALLAAGGLVGVVVLALVG